MGERFQQPCLNIPAQKQWWSSLFPYFIISMRIAVEGCLHGQLASVYRHVTRTEEKLGIKFDALIICGDFQSIRHEQDLEDMHCPEKYKQMGCFKNYYWRKQTAPLLTILIGGNHEAVNSLRQSHFGGWLAPNFYFLGQAGSIFLCKGKERIRITGCSGIFNQSDFKYCTRIERYPLRGKDRITAYHIKQLDMFRMELLSRITTMKKERPETFGSDDVHFDIMLTHDWPKDIALYGNTQELYKFKPFLRNEIEAGTFGNSPMLRLLQTAKPSYWFSAHMHVKYPAIYPHPQNYFTHFLSLDKCLDKRSCLQMLQFASKESPNIQVQLQKQEPIRVQMDSTWIGVLLLTRSMMQGNENLYYIQKNEVKLVDIKKMNELIKQYPSLIGRIKDIGKYCFDPELDQTQQTKDFLQKIGIPYQELVNICFDQHDVEENNDEIQLDL